MKRFIKGNAILIISTLCIILAGAVTFAKYDGEMIMELGNLGDYQITISKTGFGTVSAAFSDRSLKGAGILTGRVVDDTTLDREHQPVVEARITIRDEFDQLVASSKTNQNGDFQVQIHPDNKKFNLDKKIIPYNDYVYKCIGLCDELSITDIKLEPARVLIKDWMQDFREKQEDTVDYSVKGNLHARVEGVERLYYILDCLSVYYGMVTRIKPGLDRVVQEANLMEVLTDSLGGIFDVLLNVPGAQGNLTESITDRIKVKNIQNDLSDVANISRSSEWFEGMVDGATDLVVDAATTQFIESLTEQMINLGSKIAEEKQKQQSEFNKPTDLLALAVYRIRNYEIIFDGDLAKGYADKVKECIKKEEEKFLETLARIYAEIEAANEDGGPFDAVAENFANAFIPGGGFITAANNLKNSLQKLTQIGLAIAKIAPLKELEKKLNLIWIESVRSILYLQNPVLPQNAPPRLARAIALSSPGTSTFQLELNQATITTLQESLTELKNNLGDAGTETILAVWDRIYPGFNEIFTQTDVIIDQLSYLKFAISNVAIDPALRHARTINHNYSRIAHSLMFYLLDPDLSRDDLVNYIEETLKSLSALSQGVTSLNLNLTVADIPPGLIVTRVERPVVLNEQATFSLTFSLKNTGTERADEVVLGLTIPKRMEIVPPGSLTTGTSSLEPGEEKSWTFPLKMLMTRDIEGIAVLAISFKDTSGQLKHNYHRLSLPAANTILPEITDLVPADGELVEAGTVTISALLKDWFMESPALSIDGNTIESPLRFFKNAVSYGPGLAGYVPLSSGTHTVTVTAIDTMRGSSTSRSWSFRVR